MCSQWSTSTSLLWPRCVLGPCHEHGKARSMWSSCSPLRIGWPTHPSLPKTFLVLAPEVLHPGILLSPKQTGMIGCPSSRTSCDSKGIQELCSLVTITGAYFNTSSTKTLLLGLHGSLDLWAGHGMRLFNPTNVYCLVKHKPIISILFQFLPSSPIHSKLYSFTQQRPPEAQCHMRHLWVLGMYRNLPLSAGDLSEEHPSL